MMNIAICDDSPEDALITKRIIERSLKKLHTIANIKYYLEAEKVKNKLLIKKEIIDILILDINMPQISGLKLAQELRANNIDVLIIFLSSHEEFVFQSIEFQPFRYIRKTCMEKELPMAIRAAVQLFELNNDKAFILHTDIGEQTIMPSQIVYLEIENRKVSIYLATGNKVFINTTLSAFQQEVLKQENFIMIHRSCIVNANYVKSMNHGILTLKNGQQMVTSRRKYKDIKRQILNVWGKQI